MQRTHKFLEQPDQSVADLISAILMVRSDVKRLGNMDVLVSSDIEQIRSQQVTLICGGGSGHEPAHSGFIGSGMLSAAVFGNIFASPAVTAILSAIRVCAGPKGVLVIVKNYTGDRLNFGMAVERAKSEGIAAEMVVVDDDAALPLGKGITGGRGVAGTLFVHKIAGAAAAEGKSLEDVVGVARRTVESVKSMGFALGMCTLPGVKAAEKSRLPENMIEVGIGIHGEPGKQLAIVFDEGCSVAEMVTAHALNRIVGLGTKQLQQQSAASSSCVSEMEAPRLPMVAGASVALMVNNLGGCAELECWVTARTVMQELVARGFRVRRIFVGSFMTSLEMPGLSVSLLRLDGRQCLERLDRSTSAPSWRESPNVEAAMLRSTAESTLECPDPVSMQHVGFGTLNADSGVASVPPLPRSVEILRKICTALLAIESELTQYDAVSGDGDCGLVLSKGALGVLQLLDGGSGANSLSTDSGVLFCNQLADCISGCMGGSLGALLEIMLRAMAVHLVTEDIGVDAGVSAWVRAVDVGADAIAQYGGASLGMRTLLDALLPAVGCLKTVQSGGDFVQGLKAAAEAARLGMDSTKLMRGVAGRANYISDEQLYGIPDPGAYAVSVVLDSIASNFA